MTIGSSQGRIERRVVLLTGAAGDIGAASSYALAARGGVFT
jgi:NAD(P)-dependent dehydrogenase (short-subunit alcohol dehydrogenase family)